MTAIFFPERRTMSLILMRAGAIPFQAPAMLIAELLISIDGVVVVEEVVHLLGDVMCIRSKQDTYYYIMPYPIIKCYTLQF